MRVLIFGSQGAGKSTWAPVIAEKLGLTYLSTGNIFREEMAKNSEIGQKITERMMKGILIDDQTTWDVLEPKLRKAQDGFLLDGYPRNLDQAKKFNDASIGIDAVFYVTLDEEVAVKRLMERGRADDTPEGIRTRLQLYKEQTLPVVAYYQQKGIKITEIDNTPPLEEVKKKINDYLKK